MDFCGLKIFVICSEDWAVYWLQVGYWGESARTDHSAALAVTKGLGIRLRGRSTHYEDDGSRNKSPSILKHFLPLGPQCDEKGSEIPRRIIKSVTQAVLDHKRASSRSCFISKLRPTEQHPIDHL